MAVSHAQLVVHQDAQGVFCPNALHLVSPQHVWVAGVVPTQVQDLALPLVELFEVPINLFLQPTEIPLDGNMTLCDPNKVVALHRYLTHHVYSPFCVQYRTGTSERHPSTMAS